MEKITEELMPEWMLRRIYENQNHEESELSALRSIVRAADAGDGMSALRAIGMV